MSVELNSGADGLSILSLIANAGLLVQLVMLLLLAASIASWYVIDRKRTAYKRLLKVADEFERQFWSGGDMHEIYRDWNGKEMPEGIVHIFIAGYDEYNRLREAGRGEVVDGVQRAMRVATSRETEVLESHLSFLATVGSTSPYVGLFGTVWGIMNSFRAIGVSQQVTIATVAPGISEALIATAMGLAAAIPAVIAYNRFAHTAERLTNRYEIFMEEFVSIVSRQDTAPDN